MRLWVRHLRANAILKHSLGHGEDCRIWHFYLRAKYACLDQEDWHISHRPVGPIINYCQSVFLFFVPATFWHLSLKVYIATLQIGLACAFRPHTRSLDSSALRLLILEFCRSTWSWYVGVQPCLFFVRDYRLWLYHTLGPCFPRLLTRPGTDEVCKIW